MQKKMIAVAMACALVLAGCGSSSSTDDTITLKDGQSIVYAMVSSIDGNKLTYQEVEESFIEQLQSRQNNKQNSTEQSTEQSTESGSSGSGSSGSGTSGNGTSGNGSMQGMPSGTGGPPGQSSSGSSSAAAGSSTETGTEAMMGGGSTESGSPGMSMTTGDPVEITIPVGVVVHTTSDSETTFSRLESGDILKMLMEKDADGNEVIIEIWMVQ